ncbi:DUF2528 family protein [Pseudomonas sp. BN415]|uniref:DUF2528 family protein n=1 Tax=Pseudomonas sp. BN415 TaxID=2567889 RepID=UPI002456287B|nr:DUF2528 family protein [Pseudomonas sp. BN415]MDH4585611.1 DUF2528 family protein [Pseudomonas sp. BN415]
MQVNQPQGGAAEATTAANIKRYVVSDQIGDDQVTLEVNHDLLTEELATMINQFWTDSRSRVAEEQGDVVRTVIRLFGEWMINKMLAQGGAEFTEKSRNPLSGDNPGPYWTADIHNEEGWGGTVEGSLFGRCGIRCVAASVYVIDFDTLQVDEVTHG